MRPAVPDLAQVDDRQGLGTTALLGSAEPLCCNALQKEEGTLVHGALLP